MKRLLISLALMFGIFAIPIQSFATVSSTTNTVQYSGDGHSTDFAFNNNVYLTTDLNVYEVTAGVSTLLTLNTNYTVTLTAISGTTGAYTASINLAGGGSPAGALAIGTTLVIVRNIPYTQLINISDYSATPAATWNQAHDRGVILSQQLLNLVNRSILQAITATTPITFPLPVASNVIGWDSTGTVLQNYTPNTSTYISLPLAISQGGTGTTSAGAALTALLQGNPLSTSQGGTGSTAAANGAGGVVVPTGAVNQANGAVILNGSSQLPAVSGALLTNISGNFKIGSFTRDMTIGIANVSYTGVGFKPKAIIFFGGLATNASNIRFYNGFDDGITHGCLYNDNGSNADKIDVTYSINLMEVSGAKMQRAAVYSFDTDGFTLNWQPFGSCSSNTATIYYMAFK